MTSRGQLADEPFDLYSASLTRWFSVYLERLFKRRFSALRISLSGMPPSLTDRMVLYSNHPGWWDPVLLLLIARHYYPDRQLYAPMDEAALKRYALLERFGIFGIEPGTPKGAFRFLHLANRIIRERGVNLCITAQGDFADARQRPIRLQRGLPLLLKNCPGASGVPVAIEYTFWNEREPEALLRFGKPVRLQNGDTIQSGLGFLEVALEETMDALGAESMLRDEKRFKTLISGRTGTSFVFDTVQRLKHLAGGRRYDASHRSLENG